MTQRRRPSAAEIERGTGSALHLLHFSGNSHHRTRTYEKVLEAANSERLEQEQEKGRSGTMQVAVRRATGAAGEFATAATGGHVQASLSLIKK